jgi:hypothetical protein
MAMAFGKAFSGTMGAGCAILVILALIPIGCLALTGGCLMTLDSAAKRAQEAAQKAETREPAKAGGATETSSGSEPETPGTLTVTADDYAQIQPGMTYDQVVEIIGFHGEEMSRVSIGDLETVIYVWKNNHALLDASNMNATFQNGRLASMAQFGLHGGKKRAREVPSKRDRMEAEILGKEAHARADREKPIAASQAKQKELEAQQALEDAREKAKWRTWTSGSHTVHAKFIKAVSGTVHLQRNDGSKATIPMEKLSEEDQRWIRDKAWMKATVGEEPALNHLSP